MLAANLYRILGKKSRTVGSSDQAEGDSVHIRKEESNFSENVLDYSKKQILHLDKNFNFKSFLEGAKSAFNLIVTSYKTNSLEEAKSFVSKNVFDMFRKVILDEGKKTIIKSFRIVKLRASIQSIEVIKEIAKIKVEFISDQEVELENNSGLKNVNNIRDLWTFEKNITDKSNPNWILIEVNSK